MGHPGWFRPTPAQYDALVEVAAPAHCPHCRGVVSVYAAHDPTEHLQEDLIAGRRHVTLFRHPRARCRSCRRWVQKAGEGEILGSRIGPRLRAVAVYLHNDIGISLRKVPRAIAELFQFRFSPAALIGFEKLLAADAEPVADDIRKKIAASDGAVHADETYWTLDGERAYHWIHATEQYIHFQFDTSRAGEVSRELLGADFAGTLVTDCYSAYDAQGAKAKQKCLSHLARTARDWQKLTSPDSADYRFFESVKEWVKRGCDFHRRRERLSRREQAVEKAWLREELQRLQSCPLNHDKAADVAGADQALRGLLAGLSGRSPRAADQQSRRTLPASAGHPAEDHLRASHAVGGHDDGPPHDNPRDGQAARPGRARRFLSTRHARREVSRRPVAIHLCRPRHGRILGASMPCRPVLPGPSVALINQWPRCAAPTHLGGVPHSTPCCALTSARLECLREKLPCVQRDSPRHTTHPLAGLPSTLVDTPREKPRSWN